MNTYVVTTFRGAPAERDPRLKLSFGTRDYAIEEKSLARLRGAKAILPGERLRQHMTKFLSTHIELWPVERLIPYARNARTHSQRQIEQIAHSIREFGFTNPILVDSQDGILAGHARLLAARHVGLAAVPVIVLDHLTDTQKRAYVLADNKLALNAGWDDALLARELAALQEEGFDPALTGFSDTELAELLGTQSAQDEDNVPDAPKTPVARTGDLWELGPHRLLCGDMIAPGVITALLNGATARMVFTDPPYNVAYQRAGGQLIINDNLGDGFEPFLRQACATILEATDGAVYICMSSSQLHTLHRAFTEAGGHWSTYIIWAKHLFTLGRSDYQRQYEPILYGWKNGTERYWCGDRDQGDVWFFDKPTVNDLHPTMKPVELIARAIRNSSNSGDVVLDRFGGSGSTLIACEKTGRKARLIEIDPVYVDVAVHRWQEFTGKQAILSGDRRIFSEVATGRAD